MNRLVLAAVLVAIVALPAVAQEEERSGTLIQVYPLGPLVGIYAASFEQVLSEDTSLVVRPAYYNPQVALLRNLANDIYGVNRLDHSLYDAWRMTFDVGANYFPGGRAPRGFFIGGSLSGGYLTVRNQQVTPAETDSTGSMGVHMHMGYRWLLGLVSIAPRASLGYVVGLHGFEESISDPRLQDYGRGIDWEFGIELAIAF